MPRCSPPKRLSDLTIRPQIPPKSLSTLFSKCTLSTNSTSWQHGPTSSHSTSHTSRSLSPTGRASIFCPPSKRNNPSFSTLCTHTPSPFPPLLPSLHQTRHASSTRWRTRQTSDPYTRLAKVSDLKSRAAFKLLQLNDKHRVFRPGQTVVDLGFAPGSWSQVAIDLVKPSGRVVGVDVLPAQPPRGVSAIQGDFLSEEVRREVRRFVGDQGRKKGVGMGGLEEEEKGYVNAERSEGESESEPGEEEGGHDESDERCVDVVLSDMSEPWDLLEGHHKRTLSNPYYRMMNTSGNAFRDHAGSMDLCLAALQFAYSTLKVGGHFICKFYQGAEDKALERNLKALFTKVHREKPESSRSESREAYFVGIKRIAHADRAAVLSQV